MSTRNVAVTKTALARARERRQQLDRERDARDQRIEEATAAAFVALDARADAERALAAAAAEVAEALRTLLTEGVSAQRAGALLDIETSDVRRLSKLHPAAPPAVGDQLRAGDEVERLLSATMQDERAIDAQQTANAEPAEQP